MEKFFVDKFFKMECKYNLFALRDSQNNPIWDILRFDIYSYYTFVFSNSKDKSSLYKKIKVFFIGFFRVLISFFHLLLKKADVVFFEHPRYLMKNGKFADIAILDFYNREEKRKLSISNYKALQYHQYYIEYDFFFIYYKIFYKHKILEKEVVDKIFEALTSLNLDLISLNQILDIYNIFLAEKQYYTWLLKFKKVKKIIFNRTNNRKGLILAAKTLDIPIFEVQHGMFTKNHLIYSYPNILCKDEDIIVPNLLFTFDECWGKNINVPFRRLAVGNSYFALDGECLDEIKKSKNRNKLLVISSKVHSEILKKVVCDILGKTNNIEIIYKLHPNEFSDVIYYKEFFSKFRQVNVIANEIAIKDLFKMTKLVLLINSTIFYEALNYGLPIVVYKKMNYDSFIEYSDMDNVFFVDIYEDILDVFYGLLNVINRKSFFKTFDEELYLDSMKFYDTKNNSKN